MQVKKTSKLLYIESSSDQQPQAIKKKTNQQSSNQQSLKFGTYRTEAYQLQKNTIKSLQHEQDYIFNENKIQKQENNQRKPNNIHFVSQNYFQLENHTINDQQTPVQTECHTEKSILEKLENNKQKQEVRVNPEVEAEKNEGDELRRTKKSKKNIIEANFGTDSQAEVQNKVQVQSQEQTSSKNQNEVAIQQAKWDISTPRQIFAFQKVKQTERLFLVLQRQSSGLNFFSPQFDLVLGNDPRIILSCKKKLSTNLQCIISLDKNDLQQKSQHCVGKVVGNFKNNVFNLIDNRKKSIVCTTRFKQEQNITIPTPKCYEIFILNQMCHYSNLIGADQQGLSKGLDELYMIPANRKYITCLRNKKPQYCAEIGAYMLNFGGRVKKGSVKNFIVEDSKSGRQILMFGKAVLQNFNIFISGPFSPFLALGIIIPHFTTRVIFK